LSIARSSMVSQLSLLTIGCFYETAPSFAVSTKLMQMHDGHSAGSEIVSVLCLEKANEFAISLPISVHLRHASFVAV
jgi:hypothetical protein